MKKLLLTLAMLLIGGNASAQSAATTLSILTRNEPSVKWNEKSWIKGDFDYDGVVDYALRGRRGRFFVLGIVKGAPNGKSKHWTMRFGEDAGDQNALCSVKSAVITIDDINREFVEFAAEYVADEAAKMMRSLPKNSKGINVADGMCDSFHVFFDKKAQQFIWWRV